MTEMRTPYAYERTTAPAIERERPIEIALQELGKATEENAELVIRLAERLQPLLSSAHPDAWQGDKASGDDAAAPLRTRLAVLAARSGETNARIHALLQRLEL